MALFLLVSILFTAGCVCVDARPSHPLVRYTFVVYLQRLENISNTVLVSVSPTSRLLLKPSTQPWEQRLFSLVSSTFLYSTTLCLSTRAPSPICLPQKITEQKGSEQRDYELDYVEGFVFCIASERWGLVCKTTIRGLRPGGAFPGSCDPVKRLNAQGQGALRPAQRAFLAEQRTEIVVRSKLAGSRFQFVQ